MAGAVGAVAVVAVALSVDPTTRPSVAEPPVAPAASARPGPTIAVANARSGTANGLVPAREFRFDTWAQASGQAMFPLRQPGWIPAGFWLSALQSFQPPAASDDTPLDSIVATYTGPDGTYLIVDQYWLVEPEGFDLDRTLPVQPDGVAQVVAEVAGKAARWQAGKMNLDDAGNPVRWDGSVTVLTWLDGQQGYRLEGQGPDLATLIRVGEGLAP